MLVSIFCSFFVIGLFTLGGGYAMVPLIEREVVGKRSWIDGPTFLDLLSLAQVVPGPVAFNTAVIVGRRIAGFRGAVTAALGIVLPSLAVMLTVVIFLAGYRENPRVAAVFYGLRPAVAALIVATVFLLARKARLGRGGVVVALAVAGLLAQPWWSVSPVWVIAVAVGWALLRPLPETPPSSGVASGNDAPGPEPLSTPKTPEAGS